MNIKLAKRIMRIVNKEIKGSEKVTAALVTSICEGRDFTESHPVHQRIMAIYQRRTAK